VRVEDGEADAARDRLHALYVAHSGSVSAYLRRRDRGDHAEDLLAETFLVAWQRLGSIPAGGELPWLYGVAHNLLRAQWRRQTSESAAVAGLVRVTRDADGDPGEGVMAVELRAVLAALTADQVEVLLLSAWEGLTGAALATALGCSPVAARVRLHRARRALTHAFTVADDPPDRDSSPDRDPPQPATNATPTSRSAPTVDLDPDRSGVTR